MTVFLYSFGVFGWVAGALIFGAAKGAIHEVGGIVAIGSGAVTFALAAINGHLASISARLGALEVSGLRPSITDQK